MTRLYRPHVPILIKCTVAARQLAWNDPDLLFRLHRRNLARLLERLLADLAKGFGCEVADLRLDHQPPLALRPQERRGLSRRVFYVPDANDPEHLIYRPHGAHFEGSHDVKTRIRGEHGQFSDIALIKRDRRRERKKNPTAHQIKMADLREEQRRLRREFRAKMKRKAGKGKKTNWPSRPFRSKKSLERFGGTDA